MIIGIGTDIVAVARIDALLQRHGFKALSRLLHPDEIASSYARYGDNIDERHARFLAKRFAGKEAFSKAVGIGISSGMRFKDICITNNAEGAPLLQYEAVTADVIQKRLGTKIKTHISLSDERDTCVAFAIIEQ